MANKRLEFTVDHLGAHTASVHQVAGHITAELRKAGLERDGDHTVVKSVCTSGLATVYTIDQPTKRKSD